MNFVGFKFLIPGVSRECEDSLSSCCPRRRVLQILIAAGITILRRKS